MTSNPGITLTDDEILAISAREEVRWVSPLPTLAGAADAELGQAITRGWRSLLARQLVQNTLLTTDLRNWLSPAFNGRSRFRTFPVNADDTVPALGSFLTAYASADRYLVEIIGGSGLHRFDVLALDDLRDLIATALEDVYAHGFTVPADWPAEAPRPTALYASATLPGGDRILRVEAGAFKATEFRDGEARAEAVPSTVRDAVNDLFDSETRPGAPRV